MAVKRKETTVSSRLNRSRRSRPNFVQRAPFECYFDRVLTREKQTAGSPDNSLKHLTTAITLTVHGLVSGRAYYLVVMHHGKNDATPRGNVLFLSFLSLRKVP